MLYNVVVTTQRDTMTVASIIREIRGKRTLREFASMLDVTHAAVDQWERGMTNPERGRVAEWLEADSSEIRLLGVKVFAALYGDMLQDLVGTA